MAYADSACSLIVNTNADQCSVVSDCSNFPGLRSCSSGVCEVTASMACSADTDCKTFANGVCNAGSCTRQCATTSDCGKDSTCSGGVCTVAGAECSHSSDCASKGAYNVCRKNKCVKLTSDLCPNVYTTKTKDSDAYLDDNAVIFGSILPTVGPDADFGSLIDDASKMAITSDFNKTNGIPSPVAGTNWPLVLVSCDAGPNEDMFETAAHHLIDDLGVPAILGYAFSGDTQKLATDVTIKDNVLLFSSSASSDDLTMLNDNDLFWRTAPPDSFQATALNLYYPVVEAAARKRTPAIPQNGIKVAIINESSDTYGTNLWGKLEGALMFNGASTTTNGNNGLYMHADYGDSSAPDTTKLDPIVNFAPNIIFLFGFNEGPDTVMEYIEKQWHTQSDDHRPMWVYSDGGQVSSLWTPDTTKMIPADIDSEDLRTRVTGSVPAVNTMYAPYAAFRSEFTGKYPSLSPDTLGPAGAYDIVYLFAYSAIAVAANQQPLTGPNMVKYGLRRMVPGAGIMQFTIGPSHTSDPFGLLLQGKPIDIQGASGPLDFDQYGQSGGDVQIWCVPPMGGPTTSTNPPGASIYSGVYYDGQTKVLTGSFDSKCALTDFSFP
jgi:branched-chain amino acid transport system substrate-binding protein